MGDVLSASATHSGPGPGGAACWPAWSMSGARRSSGSESSSTGRDAGAAMDGPAPGVGVGGRRCVCERRTRRRGGGTAGEGDGEVEEPSAGAEGSDPSPACDSTTVELDDDDDAATALLAAVAADDVPPGPFLARFLSALPTPAPSLLAGLVLDDIVPPALELALDDADDAPSSRSSPNCANDRLLNGAVSSTRNPSAIDRRGKTERGRAAANFASEAPARLPHSLART